jgi:hypothetical protein
MLPEDATDNRTVYRRQRICRLLQPAKISSLWQLSRYQLAAGEYNPPMAKYHLPAVE